MKKTTSKKGYTAKQIAKMMDYALLKPQLTDKDIDAGAKLCAELGIGCFCVRPSDVAGAADSLERYGAKKTVVAAVVSFPHGASNTDVKMMEAIEACEDGAAEIDMVMNIGKFLSRQYKFVERDIEAVVEAVHQCGGICKVILETTLLTPAQIKKASEIAIKAGADFVKTSTGFAGGGATPEACAIMLAAAKGTKAQVKASGGIRDWNAAVAYAKMGVTRLGVSGAKEILASRGK